jgi:hypothetical protein
MLYWTAEPMTAQETTKRRTLLCSMRNGLRPQPAHLVRGSSRRIMTMRFRPANIRVINRRVCSWAVLGPAVQNQRSKLTSGNVFPLRRPSTRVGVPERCSPSRVRFAAPNNGAPLTAPGRFRASPGMGKQRDACEASSVIWRSAIRVAHYTQGRTGALGKG